MKRIKGFTLVELAVTVIIVVILMAVSVPIYQMNNTKYKMTEGYALLAIIRTAQYKYYAEYGNFLIGQNSSAGGSWRECSTCKDDVLGIDARINKYYTRFSVNTMVNVNREPFGNREFGGRYSSEFAAIAYGKNVNNLTLLCNPTAGYTII
ncbi:MAG: prepilin-type N-terminal cleavage/methylation domain-containing protein [Elusimicrobia bacterium]|nr:prepilin-type N-terminal cleavage/methylation domain-containing protein [Elusimicrobiota bacterium]